MQSETSMMRFSSAELPERERATLLREMFGRGVCNMEIVPLTETPHVDAVLRRLPGLSVMWGHNSPHRMEINRDQSRDGDMFMMTIFASPVHVRHKDEELGLSDGAALMISTEQLVATESPSGCRHITLGLQRQALSRLMPNPEHVLMRAVPADSEALWLLKSYLQTVQDRGSQWTVEIERAVVAHIYDLVALTVGATRDTAELAGNRGLRAARLDAVKRLVLEKLDRQGLTVNEVAAAQRVSPRYIQMMFEAEGTTFSAFVLGERLALAHRMLSDPRVVDRPVGIIALDAGFGDLSYFNRSFRRAYGETPSDVRARARLGVAG